MDPERPGGHGLQTAIFPIANNSVKKLLKKTIKVPRKSSTESAPYKEPLSKEPTRR